ncbi:MAG: phage portal protein, partial [Longimicrobiales bacterium]
DLFAFGITKWHAVPAFSERSGERQVLHILTRRRPGQSRGIPYLAPAIEPLKQYSRLSEAELMGALISAMLTVFIETADDGESPSVFAPVPEDGVGEVEKVVDTGRYKLESGSAVELYPGEKPHVISSNRPNPAFEAFIDAIVRHMGAGLELPFEVLIKHFRASYSASRAALLEAWRYFNRRRHWIAGAFCQPVYEWVITEAVARGYLPAPGFFENPITRRAWLRATWIGDSPGQIDPKKEAEAAVIRIDNGLSSRAREVPALSGANWEDVHQEVAKEHRARAAADLDVVAPGAPGSNGDEPPVDDDTEDEERES